MSEWRSDGCSQSGGLMSDSWPDIIVGPGPTSDSILNCDDDDDDDDYDYDDDKNGSDDADIDRDDGGDEEDYDGWNGDDDRGVVVYGGRRGGGRLGRG